MVPPQTGEVSSLQPGLRVPPDFLEAHYYSLFAGELQQSCASRLVCSTLETGVSFFFWTWLQLHLYASGNVPSIASGLMRCPCVSKYGFLALSSVVVRAVGKQPVYFLPNNKATKCSSRWKPQCKLYRKHSSTLPFAKAEWKVVCVTMIVTARIRTRLSLHTKG